MKRIALVAHDERKQDLLEWVRFNSAKLSAHEIYATGTSGKIISENCQLHVTKLKSGPMGGDQQIGAMIANFELDILVFFWDPMTAHPHDVDVKALLRMAVLYNVAIACNRVTADYLISSNLFDEDFESASKKNRRYIRGRAIFPQ
jgi:methylglyoxal synthase